MQRFREASAAILFAMLMLAPLGASASILSGTIYESGPAGTHTLSGATITVVPGNYRATSASNGTYAMSLPVGAYTVTVSASGHIAVTQAVPISGDRVLNFTLRTLAGASYSLTGSVVGTLSTGGTGPITNATVTASPGGGSVRTDANGGFQFPSLPAGTYTVRASAAGYRSAAQRVTLSSNAAITLTLTRAAPPPNGAPSTLRGTITMNIGGGGIGGATIKLTPGNYSTTADATGVFTLTNVPAGTYVAHIKAPGFRPVNRRVTIGLNSALNVSLSRVGNGESAERDDDHGHGKGKGKAKGKRNGKHGDDD